MFKSVICDPRYKALRYFFKIVIIVSSAQFKSYGF